MCLLLILLAPSVLGCRPSGPVVNLSVVTVKKQRFVRIVEADGSLRAARTTQITVPMEAPWTVRLTWLAPDGSTVKAGDVLVRFDAMEQTQQLALAVSQRATAATTEQLERVRSGAGHRTFVRVREGAERELVHGRAFQRKDPELFSRDEIIESEIDEQLQAATAKGARAGEHLQSQLGQSQVAIRTVAVDKAEEDVRRAEQRLRALEIVAPHGGVFTLGRGRTGEPFCIGDTVYHGMNVAELAVVDDMEAEAFVQEAEAAGLSEGARVEVVIEAHPGLTFPARVKQVEKVAKRRQPRSPVQYFGVTLRFEDAKSAVMKPGQRIRARLYLHDRETLVVPRPVLFEQDGRWVVYRKEPDGTFSAARVQLGPSTAGLVSVDSGLREGDVLALRDPGKTAADLLPGPSRKSAAPK